MTSRKPIVVTQRTQWTTEAAALVRTLHDRLGEGGVHIDHIGSTVIPPMASRNVIDLQARIVNLELADLGFSGSLQDLGFRQTGIQVDEVDGEEYVFETGDFVEWRADVSKPPRPIEMNSSRGVTEVIGHRGGRTNGLIVVERFEYYG